MASPSHILSYVADARKSTSLYSKILGFRPVESTPTYAVFALPTGGQLALCSRDGVEPRATLPGGTELCFPVSSDDEVRRTRDSWAGLGLKIIQEPVRTDFGFTFTAADPDGHRLRVFSPKPPPSPRDPRPGS
jgi:catechol 2,3-dioxygenase-like lactoylglutathione lyase family enzyme